MSFDQIILWVMAFGALIGAADKIIGNRFGLGEKFDEGFQAMGSLALGMVGIVCLAPVISKALGPVIIPACQAIGADPALFGSILANDMGGYSLAMELAQNLLVMKTVSGMAMAVAAALDSMEWREIVGCIAGDDTIMAAIRTKEDALPVMDRIRRLIVNKK